MLRSRYFLVSLPERCYIPKVKIGRVALEKMLVDDSRRTTTQSNWLGHLIDSVGVLLKRGTENGTENVTERKWNETENEMKVSKENKIYDFR